MQKYAPLHSAIDNFSKELAAIKNQKPEVLTFNWGNLLSDISAYGEKNNYPVLYKNLIRGLDEESILTVNRIIARWSRFNAGDADVLSDEEKDIVRNINRTFWPEIIKLSEDCYAWNKYLLPINHFEASVFYYKNGLDELKNKAYFKDKDIVDVGGFIADSAIIFSDYTSRKVYSFEASSMNYKLMLKTIKMNEKENSIVPINVGLGSKHEKVSIPSHVASDLRIDKNLNKKNSEIIELMPLDEYVEKHKLNVGLIKVDIEGAEQEFLKGAVKTIKKYKPSLLISIYHNSSDFFNIKPLIESWNLGYKFRIVKCVDGQISNETLLIAEVESGTKD